tara:strand:+ start:1971 stop:2180 length:210 start_codon:yes stop_codon:yes gene_type:complete
MATLLNDTYHTELGLLYSQLPKFPTDTELEVTNALAYLVKDGEISVWVDDDTGQVLFQHRSQTENLTIH